MNRLIVLLTFAMLTLVALAPVHAAQSALSCQFTAELQPSREGAGVFSMDGKILSSTGKLRIDTIHPLTTESIVLIADFGQDLALMLYPDTLNGFSTELTGLDKYGYLTVMRGYLEQGELKLPKGWKSEKLADAKLDGASVKHYRVTTAAGRKLEYWVDAEKHIRKIFSSNDSGKLTLSLNKYDSKAKAEDSQFEQSKDYVVSEIKDPDILLGVSL